MNKQIIGYAIGVVLLAATVSFVTVQIVKPSKSDYGMAVTVYDRVIKSGTIRAAYITYPPACMKDTTSGKMSGTFVETLEKVAENCGLKVDWTEEDRKSTRLNSSHRCIS